MPHPRRPWFRRADGAGTGDWAGGRGVAEGLESLRLPCPGATEAGLAHLAKFRNLRRLDLDGPARLTAAGLAHLGKLSGLEVLNLLNTTLPGPDARAAVAGLPLRDIVL